MDFYVYQYVTESGVPYYIGKGKGRRMHVRHAHVETPPIERRLLIKDGLSNDEAKALEKELITKYGRKVDGGLLDNIKINQWACHTGWTHSEETKSKISDKNRGKVRTAEHKKNYQGNKSKEHAENIRSAVKNLWADPEYKVQRLAKFRQYYADRKKTNGR